MAVDNKGNLGFVQRMFAMYWTTPEVLPAISKRGAFVGNNILEYTEKNRDTVKRSTLKCNTMVVQQCENIYKYGCCKTQTPQYIKKIAIGIFCSDFKVQTPQDVLKR